MDDLELVTRALERLYKAEEDPDTESAHEEADQVLCDLLAELGFSVVVEAWARVHKWYA